MSESNSAASGGQNRPSAFRTGDTTSRRVLEEVLQRTAVQNTVDQSLQLAEMEVLVEVAQRFRGVPFQLDPVVIELVKATLARQLKNTGQTEQSLAAVSERVARTLFENPESHERLRLLWERLSAVE